MQTAVASTRHSSASPGCEPQPTFTYGNDVALTRRDAVTYQRVVASPDLLHRAIESWSTPPDAAKSREADSGLPSNAFCDCMRYRATQTWQTSSGTHRLSFTTSRTTQHRPHCRYSKGPAEQRSTDRRLLARVQAFGTVLEAALRVSFFTRQGAGGFSIARSIACQAVVDSRTAPAFRVMSLLNENWRDKYGVWRQGAFDMEKIFTTVHEQLREIYGSKRGSPNDVDDRGHNIWFWLIDVLPLDQNRAVRLLVKELRDHFGVSVTQQNYEGRQVF
jgi:hypothetical protein